MSDPQTTKQMINLIAKLGKKKIGNATQQDWKDYCALVKKCLDKMQREAKRTYDERYGYD